MTAVEHIADAGSTPATSTMRGCPGFDGMEQDCLRQSVGDYRITAQNHKGQLSRGSPATRCLNRVAS